MGDFDNYIQKEHPVMYINGKENEDAVESLIKRLPPLYSEINIRFEQIPGDEED